MRKVLAKTEALVAKIAANQHGVITTEQLFYAGLSQPGITRRLKVGRLHRLYRGVYAVGHTSLSEKGRLLAAVLACDKDAVLSHESAAFLWRYLPRCPPLIQVTVPGTHGKTRRQGIVLHRSTTLRPSDVTRRHNIPVTKPARTRQDMDWEQIRTRSDIERGFFELLRANDLPLPEVNARLGPYEIDFLWRADRLVVELDSYAYHSDRPTFTSDRARDRYLQARGFRVARFSDDELDGSPDTIVCSLTALLR